MTNEKKKLMDEVDELQGFINTCEVALDYDRHAEQRYRSGAHRRVGSA